MTVNDLIRELSELPAIDRELQVWVVDHGSNQTVRVVNSSGAGRYVEVCL